MEALKQAVHRLTASEVAYVLGCRNPRNSSGWYNCSCPCTHNHKHGDKNPSLGLKDGEDGNLAVYCQTGCKPREIYEALRARGISFYQKEFAPSVVKNTTGQSYRGKKQVVAEYHYYSENGELLYSKIRYADKKFEITPKGMSDKYVLYNLPMLQIARENGWTVYLCEGEKDADRIREFDLISTTNVEGASIGAPKWRDSYTQALAGLDVVIFEDNDNAGRNHAQGVAALLYGRASSVKIVSFPELPEKGDVSDYLQDHNKDELLARVEQTPIYIPPQEIRQFPLTEIGNGQRFAHYTAGTGRYCSKMGSWFCFTGKVWKQDDVMAERLAKDVIKLIPQEARFYPTENDISDSNKDAAKIKQKALTEFVSHYKASNKAVAGIKHTLFCARSEPGVPIEINEFDTRSAGLVNVNNGTIDLRTGQLRPHSKDDYLSKISPIDYNPNATAPRWGQFMDEICQGDRQLVEFWQVLLGYILTGEANQRVFVVLWGKGRNGKSTLVETVSMVLGDDYSAGLPTSTIYARKFDDPTTTPELARLRGTRFVYASEGEEKKRLAVGMVKKLSGDEKIHANPKFKDPFDYRPMFTILFSTNHQPEITDTTDSIWHRVKLFPFNRVFQDHEVDENLKMTLLKEAPGILAWLVRGAVRYYETGMKLPQCSAVTAATTKYRADSDLVGRFLGECCEQAPGKEIQSKKLKERFQKWCSDNGNDVISGEILSKRLQEKGFHTKQRTGKRFFWQGIDVIENDDNLLNGGWD